MKNKIVKSKNYNSIFNGNTGLFSRCSSSFIIAVKPEDKCPTCGRSDSDILDLIENAGNNSDENTHVHAIGVNNVINEMCEWSIDDKDIILKAKKLEKEGYTIGFVSISYHNLSLNELIRYDDNIILLHDLEAWQIKISRKIKYKTIPKTWIDG